MREIEEIVRNSDQQASNLPRRRLLYIQTVFGIPIYREEMRNNDSIPLWDHASYARLAAKITTYEDQVAIIRFEEKEPKIFLRPLSRFGGLRRGLGYLNWHTWEGVREESALSSFIYRRVTKPLRNFVHKN